MDIWDTLEVFLAWLDRMRTEEEPEWWEEWGCSRASKPHRRCGRCTRVQSWINPHCQASDAKKLPVILQEFLWTENCERLLQLLYIKHNHCVVFILWILVLICGLISMQDMTRLRSESFQWVIQEGQPPADENMLKYARTQ